MTPHLLIRLMKKEDILTVAEIEKKSICPPWSQQAFSDAMEQDTLMVVAEETDHRTIAGYIVMYISFGEGEITNVAVDPEERNKGTGTEMMKQFFHLAAERGVERIVLEVRRSNIPAIRLYQKCGFRELGVRKNFYEQPREDALIMECLLC